MDTQEVAIVSVVAEAALVPFRKPRARPFMKKIIDGIGERAIDDVIAENKVRKQDVECKLQEAIVCEKAHTVEVDQARVDFDEVHEEVDKLIKEELVMAGKYRALRDQKKEKLSNVSVLREKLFEAQKKVAMLEVIAVNNAKMKEIREKADRATKAAEEASKAVLEHRRMQKESMEAARRAWADLDRKGLKRSTRMIAGDEEVSEEPASKYVRPDQVPPDNVGVSPKRFMPEVDELPPTVVQQTIPAPCEMMEETEVEDAQCVPSL